jgi:hypothetical protein
MAALTSARPASAATTHRPDDLSDHAHRQLIGYIGLFLPVVLYLVAGARGATGSARWHVLDSISAYYYSGAVAAFIGLLVALALFLFTYRGYANRNRRYDRIVGITAGFAALGVAFFPTEALDAAARPAWWGPTTGKLHYASAVVLFAAFAVFSLWLFRMSAPGEQITGPKRIRNMIYLTCGLSICGGMVWAAISHSHGEAIFVPESICVAAFAVSWLTKGYAIRTIRAGGIGLLKLSKGAKASLEARKEP